jgi:hypothetical protein
MADHDSNILNTRRAIIAGLAASVGAIGSGAFASPITPLRNGQHRSPLLRRPLGHAGIEAWRPLVSSQFQVATESGACAMRLVEVRSLPSEGGRPRGCVRDAAFAAVFEVAPQEAPPAGDRSYRFRHSEHGALDLFVSPAASLDGRVRLTAILN